MTLVLGSIVGPDTIEDGWVLVEGGTIAALGAGPPPAGRTDVVDATGCYVLPGLVDIHCHGGGGASVDQGRESAAATARFHWQHGTTSVMAGLSTTNRSELLEQVRDVAPIVADGTAIGIHLEGPYLSEARRGAHPLADLRLPDLDELSELLDAADGRVSMVTIAPELSGAMAAIELLVAAGVTVAFGHTDATFAQTTAAIDAGARVATHLFNGMRPIHHREGGPAAAAMSDDRVACELICDGHHVDADMCRFTYRSIGRERLVLITDACAPAGMPDGEYMVGPEPVVMSGGEVRTADGRSLAGSGLTLIAAVRFAVACGIPLVDAVCAASRTPARTIGLHDRGALTRGLRADLVLTDRDLGVTRVMRAGEWL